jgi:hypothetical protein
MKGKVFAFVGLALVLVGLGLGKSVAQAPSWEWAKTFGGSNWDEGYSVQQTSDGGFIIVGYTKSFGAGGKDVWLIKTDATGNKQWDQTFGGSKDDEGYSVQQTSDGGFIIVGHTESFGARNIWLIKTDATGNKQWDRTLGEDWGYSVQQTSDGGYILAGYSRLIKTDATGNKQWERSRGGRSVQQTSDGGYILLGSTYNYDKGFDFHLIKFDANGNEQWAKTFNYGGGSDDDGWSVQQTSDGGYILLGTRQVPASRKRVWLVKTNANGDMLWQRSFSGIHPSWDDSGSFVRQTRDGGYILVGATYTGSARWHDVWLIKTNANGDMQWDRTLGGSSEDYGWSVQQTSDGSYIIVGTTGSFGAGRYDVWLLKYRP